MYYYKYNGGLIASAHPRDLPEASLEEWEKGMAFEKDVAHNATPTMSQRMEQAEAKIDSLQRAAISI